MSLSSKPRNKLIHYSTLVDPNENEYVKVEKALRETLGKYFYSQVNLEEAIDKLIELLFSSNLKPIVNRLSKVKMRQPYKCCYCGRFIAFTDFSSNEASSNTSDYTDYGEPIHEWWHRSCKEKYENSH